MALISYPTRIQFKFGAVELLADELHAPGISRPMIVTDAGIAADHSTARNPRPVDAAGYEALFAAALG